ncbi:hypothetical protein ACYBH7_08795 [Klebsiella pneumoniae]|uniref:hypothetical protein n=1 Tax=Klebsiella pneumoniae complex TaxID=3390273 RepID=UPI00106D55FF|nr:MULTISPECIES: hypothetical protein [Klebsiella]HDS2728707.1 hypothetical protein [Klebsiella pneumoniae subsp. pneumoniae]MCP5975878.1 hypothetical protein [Klebsiella pneumoniae]MCP6046201.1 hypothetical protein [Klebsiella pneumoniae]MCP6196288.1 hypothetical protein [Klebsiella pneumoniae]MCP6316526.1 hypothetical protein [Klebsiella pneumoniae]
MLMNRVLILLLFACYHSVSNASQGKDMAGQVLKEGLNKRDWYAAGYVRASLRLLTARGMACPPDKVSLEDAMETIKQDVISSSDSIAELIVFASLMTHYPCPKG